MTKKQYLFVYNHNQIYQQLISFFRNILYYRYYINYLGYTKNHHDYISHINNIFRKFDAACHFIFDLFIFSCNNIQPWISVSGLGGHPGTYTSTGIIPSIPGKTL